MRPSAILQVERLKHVLEPYDFNQEECQSSSIKGQSRYWTEEEHQRFLDAIQVCVLWSAAVSLSVSVSRCLYLFPSLSPSLSPSRSLCLSLSTLLGLMKEASRENGEA